MNWSKFQPRISSDFCNQQGKHCQDSQSFSRVFGAILPCQQVARLLNDLQQFLRYRSENATDMLLSKIENGIFDHFFKFVLNPELSSQPVQNRVFRVTDLTSITIFHRKAWLRFEPAYPWTRRFLTSLTRMLRKVGELLELQSHPKETFC